MSTESQRLSLSQAHAAVTEVHDAISRALGREFTPEERAEMEEAARRVDKVWRLVQARRAG